MSDLIERLRKYYMAPAIMLEAADEIERLREVVKRIADYSVLDPTGFHGVDAYNIRDIALAALEDEYTIKIHGIPSKLEPPAEDDDDSL